MADYILPTPRNPILGLLSDALTGGVDWMRSPQRAQQMQGFGGLLADTGIPATVERLSYGEPLTTGRGMTTRLRPEAEAALMTLGPEAVPIGRGAMAATKAVGRGAMAAGRAGERYAERVVPQIMERGGLPAEMVAAMGRGTQSPLIVYHGSPYRFSRFDPTKIGSGEGAQAYGYGHYVAESPGVARSYQESLSGYSADGKRLPSNIGTVVSNFGGDINAAIADRERQLTNWLATNPDKNNFVVKDLQNEIKKLQELKGKSLESTGALYTIDLPDPAIARMLDWDRPFSQQTPEVRKILQDTGVVGRDDWLISGMKGREIYNRASFGAPVKLPLRQQDDQIFASQRLREAGIPGIRYLDQGSRGASAGTGTSNFVVFPGEEDLLRILSVNGGLLAP